MKKLFSMLLVIAFGLSAMGQQQKILFNSQWKFQLGDLANAAEISFNDQNWETVALPHDWTIAGPFSNQWASATGYLPGGIGWYRKTFHLSAGEEKAKYTIYFDGVYKNAEVWINGHYLGKRPNGFTSFYYDLTPHLKGGENVIAVKVDHRQFADSRWYTGSGIYRNVYLVKQGPLHIATWGVAFNTPKINDEIATAQLNVELINENATQENVEVAIRLLDKNGRAVTQQKQEIRLSGDKKQNVKTALNLTKPQRWSVDNPYLYTLQVILQNNKQAIDSYEEKVGFRSFHFDPNKGFFLNKQHLKLKGVCIHDDAGALGVATFEQVWRRRFITLKEGGVNAIRMSHNPHADFFYTLCDELGLLVMDEAFDEWEFGKNKWIAGWNVGTPGKDGYHEYFKEWATRDIQDMIFRNRNRPSIIMWSIGNEVDYPNDPYSHEVLSGGNNPQIYGKGYLPDHPPASRLSVLSKDLAAAARSVDTTRPITAALAGVVMSNTTSYPDNVDIVGYNYQEYRYAEDHVNYPNRVIYGSENGMQYNAWLAVDTNEYISGQFLWTGIDYLGEAGKWPSRSNGAGLLDLAGFPKPEYYFRQSLWAAKPMVYIGTSAIPAGEDNGIWSHKRAAPVWSKNYGEKQRVTAFSNAEEVALYLNGKLISRQRKDVSKKGYIWWDIPYQDGILVAKAFQAGKEVASYQLRTVKEAVKLRIKELPSSKNQALKELLIEAVDQAGNRVFMASSTISLEIVGDAYFRGMENGNHQNLTPYLSKSNQLYEGKILVYVEKPEPKSRMTVKVNSDELKSVEIRL